MDSLTRVLKCTLPLGHFYEHQSQSVRGRSPNVTSNPGELWPWNHLIGLWVGTPCRGDFANSLMQETANK